MLVLRDLFFSSYLTLLLAPSRFAHTLPLDALFILRDEPCRHREMPRQSSLPLLQARLPRVRLTFGASFASSPGLRLLHLSLVRRLRYLPPCRSTNVSVNLLRYPFQSLTSSLFSLVQRQIPSSPFLCRFALLPSSPATLRSLRIPLQPPTVFYLQRRVAGRRLRFSCSSPGRFWQ